MIRRVVAGLAVGVLGTALALAWNASLPGRITEAQTYDWRLAARTTPARPDIAIVEINESSVRALAPVVGRWPWPRLIHSGVINYLARARAKAIVYDVQFTEADLLGHYRIGDRTVPGPDSDAELVAAVRRAGNVVLLADVLFEDLLNESSSLGAAEKPVLPGTTYAPGADLLERPSVHFPFPALRAAAAAVGHNLLQKDPAGVSRAMFPFIQSQGVAVPSLGMAAVLLAHQVPATDVTLDGRALRAGDAVLPLRDDGQLLLKIHGPFSTPAGATTFPVYSFFDVLLSEERALNGEAPAIPESAFAGKIVFVGTSATGLADVHATAFGGSTPGVYLQATLADNVLSRDFMRRAPVIGRRGADHRLRPRRRPRGRHPAGVVGARRRVRRLGRGSDVGDARGGCRIVGARRGAARRGGRGAGRRPCVAVLRRGQGKAGREAAVREVRVSGHLSPAYDQPLGRPYWR